MFIRIVKLSASGLVKGRALGSAASRNPLAWIPLLLALPVAAAALLFLFLLFLLSLPILALSGGMAWLSLGRKRRAFAQQGAPLAVEKGGRSLPVLEAEIVRTEDREGGARSGPEAPG